MTDSHASVPESTPSAISRPQTAALAAYDEAVLDTQPARRVRHKRRDSGSESLATDAFVALERPSATALVVSRFEQLLSEGVLKPGMRLPPERDLARLLGISRPTLREALRALAVLGAVEARPGAGTFIPSSAPQIIEKALAFFIPLTGTSLLELFQTRKALEVALAGLAAQHATRAQDEAMRHELHLMEERLADLEAYNTAEERFHQAITAAAGNPLMATIMDLLQDRLREGRRRTRVLRGAQQSFGEHQAIYDAIAARDLVAARHAMEFHLDQVERLIHPWLTRSAWPPPVGAAATAGVSDR